MSPRSLERTSPMASVTVLKMVIAGTGSVIRAATQSAVREAGAGRRSTGDSTWLRQKSHRPNVDLSAQLASELEEPMILAYLQSRRTYFDALPYHA